MNYKSIINTLKIIDSTEGIDKRNLVLQYKLNEREHKSLFEQAFYESRPITDPVTGYTPVFEIQFNKLVAEFHIKN